MNNPTIFLCTTCGADGPGHHCLSNTVCPFGKQDAYPSHAGFEAASNPSFTLTSAVTKCHVSA